MILNIVYKQRANTEPAQQPGLSCILETLKKYNRYWFIQKRVQEITFLKNIILHKKKAPNIHTQMLLPQTEEMFIF